MHNNNNNSGTPLTNNILILVGNVHSSIKFYNAGCLTYFCPCYTFGKTAEAVGGDCCLHGLIFMTPFNFHARMHVRERIRQLKDLKVRL